MVKGFNIDKFHSRIVPKSTLFKVMKYIDGNDAKTPYLLIDSDRVRANISMIGRYIKNSRVFYALKANPDFSVARLVKNEDIGFEIASEGELKLLSSLDIKPERIISSNPVKSIAFLEMSADFGLNYFAFDSVDEVDKIAGFVPDANVYVRLAVPNEGSGWPLTKKFGVELDEAVGLLEYAAHKGLSPKGVTFHVGSQCTNPYNWNIAIDKARILYDRAKQMGIRLSLLNIGGGYPINYTKATVDIEHIERNIEDLLSKKFPEDLEVHIEPGRFVIGNAGVLVSTVIGKAVRHDERWLYIDVGVFNGLMESLGGIRYSYIQEQEGTKPDRWTMAGPSCDSFDVIDKNVSLMEPGIGSLILILSAGAYTVSYASEFNGFAIPRSILI